MSEFDDIQSKFQELEDGNYIVRIEGYKREKTISHAKPIRWQLKLMNEKDLYLPVKFSHIETNAGFHILMRELKKLGFDKPKSVEEFEKTLDRLVGMIVEVKVMTTNEEEGYRDVRFLRKLY